MEKKANYTDSKDKLIIDVELVSKSIDKIESKKAPGFDGITIEHIKYAHPSLIIVITTLFNILLKLELVPDNFGVGLTTPIPKYKGNKKDINADDFRGITVCPVISRIFEHCILSNLESLQTSIRQFGFKKKVSCNNAIHMVRKVIKYYNDRKSTINVGVIDLKKAFDKVNLFGVLCMLQERGVSGKIINVLENWFGKNYTTIKWNGTKSHLVQLFAGVKQGGILSPLLFALFVDNILTKLEQSGLGCFVAFKCYNSFMFADDLILISNSVTDLQLLVNLSADILTTLDLPININKCSCLRIGPRCNVECSKLKIQGIDIQWVESIKYLGVTICKAKEFKCNWDEAKRKFYCKANVILGRLGTNAAPAVLLKLIHAQGVQNLLYGTNATSLSIGEIKSLSHAYDSIYCKIFRSFDKTVVSQCQYYSGYLSFAILYELHRYSFLDNLITSSVVDDKSKIDRRDYSEYLALKEKYKFVEKDSRLALKIKTWRKFECNLDI